MELDSLIKNYQTLIEEETRIKNEKEALKEQIIQHMTSLGETKHSTADGLVASLVVKEQIKYLDEPAIINWAENNGFNNLIKKSLVTTSFNKTLKTSSLLNENLQNYITRTNITSLSVKNEK